ncbi:hypothetical protein OAS39_13570, partial [Pirellulales bacterium]|nr:hypothetical protein [Pirellulales bacterium]
HCDRQLKNLAPAAEVPPDVFGPRPTKPDFQRTYSAWKKDAKGLPAGFDKSVKKYHRGTL